MKKRLRSLLLLCIALAIGQVSYAQYNPNLMFNAGNPRNLNTTSDTATVGWLAITSGGENANAWSAVQSLPFGFTFYGSSVSSFKVSRNGLLTFSTGTAVLPNANADLPTNLLPDKTIACFWDQFSAAPPLPPNAKIYTRVFGTAGNRQLWVKWINYEIGNPVCAFANFACVLEEGTNKVFMVDMNYSSPANVTATIGLQNTNSQAIQFGSSNFGFFSTNSGPAVADNDYYEFTPQVTGDAGIVSIDSPTMPFGSGISNVMVTLKNFSQSALNNVTIKWKVNNVQQPDFTYSGSLAANATASVNIGSYNFADGFSYNIEAETFSPNGSNDINTANDKATRSVCPMLLGNYTIGGTSGDFNTIAEAVAMLQCAGVETDVTFTLAPGSGPYNEQITLGPVAGASAVKTITFSGGMTREKISHTGSHTIQLNGADYIILENLTIENLNASTGSNILLVNGANHNIIRNNYFPLKSASVTYNGFSGVVLGSSNFTGIPGNGNFNQIIDNEFDNGTAAIVMRSTATGLDEGNIVANNIINNPYAQGIISSYQKLPYIKNNTIQFGAGNTSTTGIQCEYNDNFEISGNYIRNYGSRGIYIANGNNISGGVNSRAKVINNMIISSQGGFGDGISFGSNSTFVDVLHNSVSINGGSGDAMFITIGTSIAIKNNSFAVFNPSSTFNRAFYGGTNVTYAGFDNNNFYITGTGPVARINNNDVTPSVLPGYGGYNTNSHVGDPGYLDPASDLHAITVQLNNKGDNSVNVLTDFDGQVRPAVAGSPVDIGADEFTIYPSDAAVTALVAPAQNGRVLTSKSLSATQDITIKVTNSGGSILSNIPVFYSINGTVSAQELVPGPLNPGTSTNFTFTAKANLSAVADYTISAYASVANDDDRSNDTLSQIVIRQLPNSPVSFPVTEDFEATASLVLTSNYVGLTGAERFDYEFMGDGGRLRSFAGTGFSKSGTRAITLDRHNFGSSKPVNYLIMTMNLAAYTTTDVMMLDFSYAAHTNFSSDDPANRVWARGNDTAPWVEIYNLFANRIGAGNYKPVTNINLSAALAAAGQTYSSSTQIRFGQSGTSRATSVTCCDGYSFDDIAVRKLLQTDLGITALVQPAANSCGDSTQTVSVKVKNFGVAAKSNIPVVVTVTGPVNTTLTGTLAGPLNTDQEMTLTLGNINTYTGGVFGFTAYTNMVNDEDRNNDTLKTDVFLNAIPVMPLAANGSGCQDEPITIAVSGTADSYNFYASNTSTAILANSVSGTFTTPPLAATTTYYASAVNSTAAQVGPATNAIGVGGSINQFDAGLEFNVLRDLILDSVFVYPASAGNVKINLLNASGAVIATKTVAVSTPNVKTPIPVNFKIAPGNGYKLDAMGSTVTALFRNTNGAVFPYEIPQALSIIRGTFGVGPFYYFFYDWKVTILECESNRVPVIATVNPKPVVDLGNDIRNCNGTAVTLDAGNAGSGFAYLWSEGSTSQILSVATSGTYHVKVTNPVTGCSSTDTINVFIGTSPVVDLGADILQCGGVVTLNAGNTGSGFDYSWSNGAATQTIGVTASGTYSVTVTNPATGCSTTDQIQVTINPSPVVNLGPDKVICGTTALLDAGNASSGFTYLWSNGATSQTTSVTTSGTYSVTVTNPATGCSNTDQIDVTINPAPVVDLGADISQCGGTATLDAGNAGSGFTYLWSTGATTQTIVASTSGTYSVTVKNPVTNCTATDQIVVAINAIPVVNLGTDKTQCGGTVTLDAGNTGSGYNYLWNTGATTRTIAVSASGTYWAKVTNPSGNCFSSDTVNVTINPVPTATVTAGGPTTFCAGDSVTLTGSTSASGATYAWQRNGTAIPGATAATYKAKISGSYTLVVTAGGCPATSAATIVTANPIAAVPTITTGGPTTFCSGDSVVLTAASTTSGATFTWFNNSVLIPGATAATLTVKTPGSYTAVAANGTCASTASAATTVTVNASPNVPTVTAGSATTFCSGDSVVLTVSTTSTGLAYGWALNGTAIPGATDSVFVARTAGNYTAIVSNGTCTAPSAATVVTVNATPATPVITQAGNMLSSSAATGNQWYLNGTPISGATGKDFTPAANGNYSVTVTQGTCSATSATFAFTMTGMADELLVSQFMVYPNPTNGKFEVKLTELSKQANLTLYSLTGQVLHKVEVKPDGQHTTGYTFDLENYAQGIYVLKLETDGKFIFRKVMKE